MARNKTQQAKEVAKALRTDLGILAEASFLLVQSELTTAIVGISRSKRPVIGNKSGTEQLQHQSRLS
jgi:hypothetical protein